MHDFNDKLPRESASSAAAGVSERARHRLAWLADVRAGLAMRPRHIPPPGVSDLKTIQLLETHAISEECYVPRLERDLVRRHAGAISDLVGEDAHLVELGGTNTQNVRLLLAALRSPASYMPVDISSPHLWSLAMQMQLDHPYLAVRPLSVDFRTIGSMPSDGTSAADDALFLAFGSVLGEVHPVGAAQILRRLASATERSIFVCGMDLDKDPKTLVAACDDRAGVVGELNRHLLVQINRELDADFDPGAFVHGARFNAVCSRTEMFLRSTKRQDVRIAGETIRFDRNEIVLTRRAYKYSIAKFHRLARRAGLMPLKAWTDPDHWYALHLMVSPGYLH